MEKSEKLSVYYHDLFDYPLTFSDLIKWDTSKNFSLNSRKIQVVCQNNYFFLKGREGLIYKRILKTRISIKKMDIAQKASKVLSIIPGVKMVAVTGSLAMNNAGDKSDIDLMIITKNGTLWTTRLFVYLFICLFGIQKRRPFDKNQKDKLCLNMWMDEHDIIWKSKRNIYTAHEIAQILPLVNKERTYEKFLYQNKWILKYWPNAVRIENCTTSSSSSLKIENSRVGKSLLEKIAYQIQLNHMKSKITCHFPPSGLGKCYYFQTK